MKVLAIPDLHAPFHDEEAVDRIIWAVADEKPDAVVQMGDATDQYSHSPFRRGHSEIKMTPEQEIKSAREFLESFWKAIGRRTKKGCRLYQIDDGNHDVRLSKQARDRNPDSSFIIEDYVKKMLRFDNVESVNSGNLVLDGVVYEHGYRRSGQHAPFNQCSTVTGHTHKGRVEWFANRKQPYFELNCGHLADINSVVQDYRDSRVIKDVQQGYGLIVDGGKRVEFVPIWK